MSGFHIIATTKGTRTIRTDCTSSKYPVHDLWSYKYLSTYGGEETPSRSAGLDGSRWGVDRCRGTCYLTRRQ